MTHPLPSALQMFEEMADAVYLLDPATSDVLWTNRSGWQMLGLTPEEVLDHSVLSLQMDVRGLPQWTEIAAVIRSQSPYVFVGRHRHRDGHEVPVEVVTTRFEQDGREYFLSVARDATRRLALEHELHAREQQLWFALNEAADGLWDWDIASGQLFFSPQLKRMLGYGPEEMSPVIDTWTNNLHPEDAAQVLRQLHDHLEGKRQRYEAEYRLRNRNGHYLWVHDHGRVCDRDAQGKPTRVVGMVQDISDRKMMQFELERLAANDGLTGLPSRRHGEEFLAAELELCRRLDIPLGLALLDLDRFKAINDSHGHLKGDEVLQEVARVLAGSLRRSDLVYRWGGEEFVVVCPNTGLEDMRQVAAKVRDSLKEVDWRGKLGVEPVTASLGLAVFPYHGRDARGLVCAADAALYRAKAGTRDCAEVARAEDAV